MYSLQVYIVTISDVSELHGSFHDGGTSAVIDSFIFWLAIIQMDPASSGTLVYKIDPLAPAAEVLEQGDVVLEVDNVPIADDGTVEFRDDERVEFTHLVNMVHSSHSLGHASPTGMPSEFGNPAICAWLWVS